MMKQSIFLFVFILAVANGVFESCVSDDDCDTFEECVTIDMSIGNDYQSHGSRCEM